jgi:hypothetical protein
MIPGTAQRPYASTEQRPNAKRSETLTLIGLVIVLLGLCAFGGALARYVWFGAVIAFGAYAWRRSPTFHLQTVIVLFAIAPLLRRLVDFSAGYEPSAQMLVAPLLVLMIPVGDLLFGARVTWNIGPAGRPFLLALICACYGIVITALGGDLKATAACVFKLLPPIVYGLCLISLARSETGLVSTATRTLFLVMLLLSVYGIIQYISPQPWDRAWMMNSKALIWSIGDPEAYKVRVFSTMAAPASFATFAIVSCLLMAGEDWRAGRGFGVAFRVVAGVLIVAAGFLTTYRTAWTAFAGGMVFLFLLPATRARGFVLIGFAAISIAAATMWNLSDGVVSRLETFANGMQSDDSAVARTQELQELYADSDSLILGEGYGAMYPASINHAIDGTVVESLRVMGVTVGSMALIAIIWAAVQAIFFAIRNGGARMASLGAVNVAALILLPLASVTDNELGFLFWAFAGLAAGQSRVSAGNALGRARQRKVLSNAVPR